jgi:predicted small metal-binding protein
MAKVMKCREVGLDCDFVATGENEGEIMAKVAKHAKEDHGMTDISPEVVAKVQAAIHEG